MTTEWPPEVRGAIPRNCTMSISHGTCLIHDGSGWLIGAVLGGDGMAQRRACLIVSIPDLLEAMEMAIREERTDVLRIAFEEVRAQFDACRTQ